MNLRKDHYSRTKMVSKPKITHQFIARKVPFDLRRLGSRAAWTTDRARLGRSACHKLFLVRGKGRKSAEASGGTPSRSVSWGLKRVNLLCYSAPGCLGAFFFSFFTLVRWAFSLTNHSKPRGDGAFYQPQANPSCLCCQRRDWTINTRKKTTLGGGSLGSCVDEERSQLRELM